MEEYYCKVNETPGKSEGMEKPPLINAINYTDSPYNKKLLEAQRDADVEWYRDKIHKQDFIWQQQIEQAEAKIAREIFEEIERDIFYIHNDALPNTNILDLQDYPGIISIRKWQSLKDKYNKQSIGR